ncbi:MAG: polysaccharide biosynthesis tyrosine autokinase [Chryseolinea sp.]
MNSQPHPIKVQAAVEGIDFNKLRVVARSNWTWLVALFLMVNFMAYVGVRYTKNLYRSQSVLKLEIKEDATEFGIKPAIVEDQSIGLIAGEIEIIQSRLFLSRVVDSSALDVSYFSVGRVLNDELFQSHPFTVIYKARNHNLFDRTIGFTDDGSNDFTLTLEANGTKIKGKYNVWIPLDGVEILLIKNENFSKGDEIGYSFVINSENALLDYLLNNLTAEPLNYNANTIQIAFKDNNPFKANTVLNMIDTTYLQYSNEQKNLATKQKIQWISQELVNIETKMEDFENYFENFTLQNKTNNMDEDLKQTVGAINRIDSQRFEFTRRLGDLDNLLKSIEDSTPNISVVQRTVLSPSLIANLERLEKLSMDQSRLKLSYNENTLAYRQKQEEGGIIRQKTIDQLTNLRADNQRKLGELDQHKSRLEHSFANLPDKSTQFSKNLRYYKLYEQFYLSLMQSKSQFEITQAGSIQDFKILSPATMPDAPISPNKLMIAGIGFVSGLMLMLLLLGTLYVLNNKITALKDIENISGVPVLGVVPATKNLETKVFHVVTSPRSKVAEAIKTLRTNLDFFSIHTDKKVITISSTVSGEGKSFIAMNLGGVMALQDKKVVLLDLDMRKPKEEIAGNIIDKSKGISTILIAKNKWQDCVTTTSLEGFDYIPSGPHPPNPSELLMNSEFAKLLEDLKKHYDCIVLDTPPVGLVTDGIIAMRHSDITIYIFRANYSKKDFLLNLQRIININKFSNITSLLNALPDSGDQAYGYGYYEEPESGNWFKKIFRA